VVALQCQGSNAKQICLNFFEWIRIIITLLWTDAIHLRNASMLIDGPTTIVFGCYGKEDHNRTVFALSYVHLLSIKEVHWLQGSRDEAKIYVLERKSS
jgi:hypothetical protein